MASRSMWLSPAVAIIPCSNTSVCREEVSISLQDFQAGMKLETILLPTGWLLFRDHVFCPKCKEEPR